MTAPPIDLFIPSRDLNQSPVLFPVHDVSPTAERIYMVVLYLFGAYGFESLLLQALRVPSLFMVYYALTRSDRRARLGLFHQALGTLGFL
jgi:hypothetical protein